MEAATDAHVVSALFDLSGLVSVALDKILHEGRECTLYVSRREKIDSTLKKTTTKERKAWCCLATLTLAWAEITGGYPVQHVQPIYSFIYFLHRID